jgi:hypothetical protein
MLFTRRHPGENRARHAEDRLDHLERRSKAGVQGGASDWFPGSAARPRNDGRALIGIGANYAQVPAWGLSL